jgi:serine/threonine protein kinase/formylglycine-generating enzyme required for sulfatase activity
MDSTIGNILNGRYQVTGELGAGAMGVVYRAHDQQAGIEVAIKVLPPALARDPQYLARFEREATALRDLNHPNIVTFIDSFQEESNYYLVMEYMPGGNLYDLLQNVGTLPVEQARQIAIDICDALIRAHRLDIIHRDLKPENILFDAEGHPRLADFGVAGMAASEEGTRLTGTGMQMGTPYYMSPEAWQGQRLDAQSDIWSLGIVLYEILSGELPFHGETSIAVMREVLQNPTPDIRQHRDDIPEGLYQIVRKALAKDKAQRYRNVRDLSGDLERGEPAVPLRGSGMAGGSSRRGGLLVAGIIVILVIIAAVIGLFEFGGDGDSEVAAQATFTNTLQATVSPTDTPTSEPPTQSAREIAQATLDQENTLAAEFTAIAAENQQTLQAAQTETATPTSTVTNTPIPTSTDTPSPEPTEVAVADRPAVTESDILLSTLPRQTRLFPVNAEDDFTLETQLNFQPEVNFQNAGLYVELAEGGRMEFVMAYCDETIGPCVGRGVHLDVFTGLDPESQVVAEIAPYEAGEIQFRLSREGDQYTAQYRLDATSDWQTLFNFELDQDLVQVGLIAQTTSGAEPSANPFDAPPIEAQFSGFILTMPDPSATNTLDPAGDEVGATNVEPVRRNDDWQPVRQQFDGVHMMLVPPGCFIMGDDNGTPFEQPDHRQCLEQPFWIDQFEVTNEYFGSIGCSEDSSEPNQPRNCVDWFTASAYCSERGARLPTEVEFEYVMRGPEDLLFPWGNVFDNQLVVAGTGVAANVGSVPRGGSWIAAYDVLGNVWEWTSSIFADYPYTPNLSHENPEDSTSARVIRGGSFNSSRFSEGFRSAIRMAIPPDSERSDVGFRCARDFDAP